jgi:hypothetical protein
MDDEVAAPPPNGSSRRATLDLRRHLSGWDDSEGKRSPAVECPDFGDIPFNEPEFRTAVDDLLSDNVYVRLVAATNVEKGLRLWPNRAARLFEESHIEAILGFFESPDTWQCAMQLLGWVTYVTADHSEQIYTGPFVRFIARSFQQFDDALRLICFVLLANILFDVREAERMHPICEILVEFREFSDQFLRLITILTLCNGLSPETFEKLIAVHIDCVLADQTCLALKRRSLAGLNTLVNVTFNSVIESQLLRLTGVMEPLLQCAHRSTVFQTLRLLNRLFGSQAFCDSKQIAIGRELRELAAADDDQIRELAIRVFCQNLHSPDLDPEDPLLFADFEFEEAFREGTFATKVGIIDLCRLLTNHFDRDLMLDVFSPSLLELFDEIAKVGDIAATLPVYHFACSLLKQFEGEKEGIATIAEAFGTEIREQIEHDILAPDPNLAEAAAFVKAMLPQLEEAQ